MNSPTEATRVAIECAIARGETLTDICARLDIPYVTVEAVYKHMTRLAFPPPRQPHGTHSGYVRHRAADEKPCRRCAKAEKHYQANAHHRRKNRVAA